jgi:hypothetical protein
VKGRDIETQPVMEMIVLLAAGSDIQAAFKAAYGCYFSLYFYFRLPRPCKSDLAQMIEIPIPVPSRQRAPT